MTVNTAFHAAKRGDKVRLLSMDRDRFPIPTGITGTVVNIVYDSSHVPRFGLDVIWDRYVTPDGVAYDRRLMLLVADTFEILTDKGGKSE